MRIVKLNDIPEHLIQESQEVSVEITQCLAEIGIKHNKNVFINALIDAFSACISVNLECKDIEYEVEKILQVVSLRIKKMKEMS
jgi:hypothetical protein